MKKTDLRTGNIVIHGDGSISVVFLGWGDGVLVDMKALQKGSINENCITMLADFTENLQYKDESVNLLDIYAVYSTPSFSDILKFTEITDKHTLLWKRPTIKLTIQELKECYENKYACVVDIVV